MLQIAKNVGKRKLILKKMNRHTAWYSFIVMFLESMSEIYALSKLLGHTEIVFIY